MYFFKRELSLVILLIFVISISACSGANASKDISNSEKLLTEDISSNSIHSDSTVKTQDSSPSKDNSSDSKKTDKEDTSNSAGDIQGDKSMPSKKRRDAIIAALKKHERKIQEN